MPRPISIRPQLTHVGFYAADIERMIAFYSSTLGLVVTDRGPYMGDREIVFMSSNVNEHHQIVLASGLEKNAAPTRINQISFRVESLEQLTEYFAFLKTENVHPQRAVFHGNAWSFYFLDPEGNRIEIYTPSDWYVEQPFGEPVDFNLKPAQLRADGAAMIASKPSLRPIGEWASSLGARLAAGQRASID